MPDSSLSVTRMVDSIPIIPAKPGDLPAIHDLIRSVNLPLDGLEHNLEYFWVAWEGEHLVGTAGLEVYANQVLLRSVAVAPSQQGNGLGHTLTETALAYITTRQYQAVYLLTTTAESFFRRYGFLTIPRTQVPASVQASIEFQSACPTTATCMVRTWTYSSVEPIPELRIRPARFPDLRSIREIHNQGILDRVATLDTEPHTKQEILEWFYKHGPRHPVLVAEIDGGIAGWASLNMFNPRQAYQYVADLSVYIARPWQGKGIGMKLLQAIIPLGSELGYHKIVLSAFPFNTAGMRLYKRQGFTTVGIYKEMGLLDGRWVDTVIMEKLLHTS
jgi:L-amino acid N-acyltransferase YncA